MALSREDLCGIDVFIRTSIALLIFALALFVDIEPSASARSLSRPKRPLCRKVLYFPIDCQDIQRLGNKKSGVYKIFPRGTGGFLVYCDLTTDGGGWTVLQRRIDGSVGFYRKWKDYEYGFGHVNGEYWIGNDRIHQIVAQGWYEARFDLEDFSGNRRYAKYKLFDVGGRSSGYRLTIGDYLGTAGDGMTYHSGAAFHTLDRDVNTCSKRFKGGFWYKHCHYININGLYLKGNHKSYADGVNWEKWLGNHYSLKSTDMKIRRR